MDTFIWGGTGQAKVIRPIVEGHGHRIIMVYDKNHQILAPFSDIPLIHDTSLLQELFLRYDPPTLAYAIAIGGHRGAERVEIGESLRQRGFEPLLLVHHRGWVAESARLGEGCQILGMAAVSEEVIVGRYCIINTNASVDHESHLGDGVHVMPGATIAGCVKVGNFASIGSNATVLPRLRIGARAFIAAGAVVTRDVPDGALVKGIPAR